MRERGFGLIRKCCPPILPCAVRRSNDASSNRGESIRVERREMTLADASDKYEVGPGRLLQSSAPRGWSNMFAEFRLHVSGRADTFVQPVTEISMVFRGEGLVRRRDSGETHTTYAKPGVIWLCSAGQQIDWLEMEASTAPQRSPCATLSVIPCSSRSAVPSCLKCRRKRLRVHCWSSPLAAVSPLGCCKATQPLRWTSRLAYRAPENSRPDVSVECWNTSMRTWETHSISAEWQRPRI
jgi:hypothetical protein